MAYNIDSILSMLIKSVVYTPRGQYNYLTLKENSPVCNRAVSSSLLLWLLLSDSFSTVFSAARLSADDIYQIYRVYRSLA